MSLKRVRLLVVIALWVLLGGTSRARPQTSPTPPPEPKFDVASIKPNNSGRLFSLQNFRAGRFTATNATVQILIMGAYDIHEFELTGGPGWITSDRFDITATAPGPQEPETVRALLRSLLGERFALATHRETRQLPVYRLAVARSDRKLGSRLVKSDLDCALALARGQVPDPCTRRAGTGSILATAIPFKDFVRMLQSSVDRAITDDTGLAGSYDLGLDWAAQSDDPSKPSLFTALEEQLGLKLESARGPVDVLVIDRIEHPTPD
jgi:uncharacterized protein (TIGR03435 family)